MFTFVAQINPNPSLLLIAMSIFYLSLSLDEYSGISKWLKQVCELGSLSLSGPSLPRYNVNTDKPAIGARLQPVVKVRNFFF